jgi:hypothetical protein
MNGICQSCLIDKKIYSSFGKLICIECIEKRKTGIKGNSGMIYNKNIGIQMDLFNEDKFYLELVKKSNPLFVKWYIEHYPESKGIVGRQLNYIIYKFKKPIGIISASSPPLNYKLFREYFSIQDDIYILNNNVFRLVESEKNDGSQILKLYRDKIKSDYKEKYKTELKGIVTFIEKPRTGAVYKADNWEYIGETKGIEVTRSGDGWINKSYKKTDNIKLIFAYKYYNY